MEPAADDTQTPNAERVLLIAPAAQLRMRLGLALRDRGLDVTEAVSAFDAVRTMRHGLPGCILLADRLGTENVGEFVRGLRAVEKTRRLPVAILAATDDGARALEAAQVPSVILPMAQCASIDELADRAAAVRAQPVPGFDGPPPVRRGAPEQVAMRMAALDAAFGLFDDVVAMVRDEQLPGPMVPQVLAEARALFRDQQVDLRDVVDFVGRHQALAARVMLLANSAYHARQGRVSSVQDAIARLGLQEAGRVVQAAAALAYLVEADAVLRPMIAAALGRGYFVAVVAEHVARKKEAEIAGAVFTAGLFHNVGESFLYYTAALLRQKGRIGEVDAPSLAQLAANRAQHLNAVVRRALSLPPEVEALHGEVSLKDKLAVEDRVVQLVQQAMWVADRALGERRQQLEADGESALLGMSASRIAALSHNLAEFRSVLDAYR